MDINVNDDHTVGCAIARVANAHLSNSDDCSHNDYGSDGVVWTHVTQLD